MKKGQLRRIDTSACQRETWINTVEGWRLRLIDSVQPLFWSADGKRVDPSKSYDPDAPAYAPDVEVTSPCRIRTKDLGFKLFSRPDVRRVL